MSTEVAGIIILTRSAAPTSETAVREIYRFAPL